MLFTYFCKQINYKYIYGRQKRILDIYYTIGCFYVSLIFFLLFTYKNGVDHHLFLKKRPKWCVLEMITIYGIRQRPAKHNNKPKPDRSSIQLTYSLIFNLQNKSKNDGPVEIQTNECIFINISHVYVPEKSFFKNFLYISD